MKVKIANVKQQPFSRSPVDIIIPFHGEFDKVVRLVRSILLSVKSNPYQITLVDDGSVYYDKENDQIKSFVDEFKNFDEGRPSGTEPIVQTVRSEKQLGFGAAALLGYQHTKQPWVMFMHSDCVVEDPNWMLEMGRSLLGQKKIKMVGAKSQASFVGDPRCKGVKSQYGDDLIVNDSFLPLYCVMCHRDLFKHIGGFIKQYPYAGYEDEELAFRMNHYGFQQAICGKAWVYHEGSGTLKTLVKKQPEIRDILDTNRERCIADIQKLN